MSNDEGPVPASEPAGGQQPQPMNQPSTPPAQPSAARTPAQQPAQSPWGEQPVWHAPAWNQPPAPHPYPGAQQPGAPQPGTQQPGYPQSGTQQPGWAVPPQQWQGYAGYGAPGNPYGYVAPPKPGVIPLRPLSVGEILDGAFQAARKNAGAVFGSALAVEIGVLLLTVALSMLLVPGLGSANIALDESSADEFLLTFGGPFLLGAGSLEVLSLVALLVLQGLLTIPVARAVLNRRTSFGLMFRLARGSMGRLAGMGFLYLLAFLAVLAVLVLGVVVLAGTAGISGLPVMVLLVLAVVAAGIWVAVRVAFAPAAVVMEGVRIFPAVARSWHLTRGSWWRIFGIFLLTTLIVGVITSVITTPLSFIFGAAVPLLDPEDPEAFFSALGPAFLVTTAVTSIFTAIGFAFQAGVTALLYLDMRIRREGFDQVLMRELEHGPEAGRETIPGRDAAAGPRPGS